MHLSAHFQTSDNTRFKVPQPKDPDSQKERADYF